MKSPIDVYAGLAYVAGGGLVSVAVGVATFAPHYQTQILAISGILLGVSGLLVRLHKNQTPTNTVQVFDLITGSTVAVKTIAAPAALSPPISKGVTP